MQLVTTDKTQALSLLPALRTGDTVALTKAVMATRIDEVEKTREQRLNLENEVAYLRIQYKHSTPAKRENIEAQARALIATIEALPEFPPLTALARKTDTQTVLDDLCVLLCWMNDQLNIANKLNIDQVEATAVTVLGEYGHLLGMEDIAACLRRAIRGDYGQIYARLDAAVKLDWLNRFETEMIRERINRADARHANVKESIHDDRGVDEDKKKNRAALAQYLQQGI